LRLTASHPSSPLACSWMPSAPACRGPKPASVDRSSADFQTTSWPLEGRSSESGGDDSPRGLVLDERRRPLPPGVCLVYPSPPCTPFFPLPLDGVSRKDMEESGGIATGRGQFSAATQRHVNWRLALTNLGLPIDKRSFFGSVYFWRTGPPYAKSSQSFRLFAGRVWLCNEEAQPTACGQRWRNIGRKGLAR